ncbi:NADPH-dependent FMN reductase [Halalkalibacillus halophilus]|uniref:NADPH-dependent FMN reductase n=1 Tax=Halalkalibacillus halophilus TaxID=392827 RepID=UPI00041056B2|nr:NAD(P)H-dependent oxidoreductase [Halalkalibacillus halophilus]
MSKSIKIIGISGSLREDSVNKKLLERAEDFLPENASFEYVDYKQVPVFNEDEENPLPEVVANFKEKVESADIVLFATPQYNGSFPGVLKNGIDWLTRPGGNNSISGKVAGIVGATPGNSGTIQAQLHLREVLSHLNVHVPPQPRVLVSSAGDLFDEHDNLVLPEAEVNRYEKLISKLIELV